MLTLRWKACLIAVAVYGGIPSMLSAQTYTDAVKDLQKSYQKEWNKAAEANSPASEPAPDSGSEDEKRRQSVGLGGALGLPKVGDEQALNVLGVLQYCMDDGLGDASMQTIHQQLLGRVNKGHAPELQQNSDYRQGLSGILSGQDEKTFDLKKLDQNYLRKPACDYIANEASFLL